MPIITISRGTMSGGRAVAECLAETLGCPCIGREVLQDAAAKLGASMEDLAGKFETPPGLWARLTHKRKNYLLAVQTALAEHCARGSLVYHGLAGRFLLAGLPGVLRIRLIAPLPMRVRSLTDAHPMDQRAAEDFIHNVDHDRKRWVKLMYGQDVEDPTLYDVVLNMDVMSVQAACETIAELAERPEYRITDEMKAQYQAFAARCREQLAERAPEP
jgi:cytidylate kinase